MRKLSKKKIIEKFTDSHHFLPDATRGAVRGLTNKQLIESGSKDIVVNTLHLLISPGPERIRDLGGIHNFMNWEGVILSDSGGFQVFSLIHLGRWDGKITDDGAIFKSPKDGSTYELTPERSIDIQMALGTDIMVVLDDCRKGVTSREEAEVSVENTINWAKRCKEHFMRRYSEEEREGKILTAVVQGANFRDLREKCAEELIQIGFDGYNFGGFLLDDEGKLVIEQLKAVSDMIPKDSIKYAMGVGKPEDIVECARLGYKLFDTVLPTRNARHGTLYVASNEQSIVRISNVEYATDQAPLDPTCDCILCKDHSRAYLHHLLRNKELTGMTLATIHNLTYYQRVIDHLNDPGTDLSLTAAEILENFHSRS